jgi:wyosine [tRNA(Phe)-imidazoG37] synthetase (radical SAM superfamily)
LADAHLVVPSLDAGHSDMFQAVNRPHRSISFDRMLDGLIAFRQEYRGEYWLEVFLLAGHTAVEGEARKIQQCVARIRPDRVQLNTATRPTAEDYAIVADRQRMLDVAAEFDPPAEVIADYHGVHAQSDFAAGRRSVLEMIQRRPCSLEDVADGLGLHRNEAVKYIEELDAAGVLTKRQSAGRTFYSGRRDSQTRAS